MLLLIVIKQYENASDILKIRDYNSYQTIQN